MPNNDAEATDSTNDTINAGPGGESVESGAGNDTIEGAQSSSSAEVSQTSTTTDSSSEVFPSAGDGVLEVEMPKPAITQVAGVGRIVHYWDNAATGPYPAIVTGIVDEAGLQLTVFRPGSLPTPYSSAVPYVDDRRSDGPAWRWPDGMVGVPMALANFSHVDLQTLFPGATGGNAFGVSKEG